MFIKNCWSIEGDRIIKIKFIGIWKKVFYRKRKKLIVSFKKRKSHNFCSHYAISFRNQKNHQKNMLKCNPSIDNSTLNAWISYHVNVDSPGIYIFFFTFIFLPFFQIYRTFIYYVSLRFLFIYPVYYYSNQISIYLLHLFLLIFVKL